MKLCKEILEEFGLWGVGANIIIVIAFIIFYYCIKIDIYISFSLAFIIYLSISEIKMFFENKNKNKENNNILLLIDLKDILKYRDFQMIIFDQINQMLSEYNISDKLNFVIIKNYFYNNRMYKYKDGLIKKIYKYDYIVRIGVALSKENGEEIYKLQPNITFNHSKIQTTHLKKYYEIICRQFSIIYSNNEFENLICYSKNMTLMTTFIIGFLLPILNIKNINKSKLLFKGSIEQSKQLIINCLPKHKKIYKDIEDNCKIYLSRIYLFEYEISLNANCIYNDKEIIELEKKINEYKIYAGEDNEYYNRMAILSFIKKNSKNKIEGYLIKSYKKSETEFLKNVINLNRAFINIYFKDYKQGIIKYRKSLNKMSKLSNESEEFKYENIRILNDIENFIYNINMNENNFGCKIALAIIYSFKQDNKFVNEILKDIKNEEEYLKLTLSTKEEFKNMIFDLIDINIWLQFRY